MDRKIGFLAAFGLALSWSTIAHAWITDVKIHPSSPQPTDPVLIEVKGGAGSRVLSLSDTLVRNGYNLDLGIHLKMNNSQEVMLWTDSINVGPLPAGSYHLRVLEDGTLVDLGGGGPYYGVPFNTSFTVLPEPSSVGLLFVPVAIMMLRRSRAASI